MINTSKASASSLSGKIADCEWASEQCMGAVSAAYSHLLEKAKTKGGCDDITVADIAQETKMPPMTVTACLWTITNGECLPGARPIKENILRVLKEIDLYHGAYGCSPTIREIQDDLNLSLSTIKISLDVLVGFNCIDYRLGRSRSIKPKMHYEEGEKIICAANEKIIACTSEWQKKKRAQKRAEKQAMEMEMKERAF